MREEKWGAFDYSGQTWEKTAYAPFDGEIYRNLLKAVIEQGGSELKVVAKDPPEHDKVNIYLRHDIDFAEDVTAMERLTKMEESVGKASAVYIRTDGQEYDPADLKVQVQQLHKKGFEVGLHTTCYLYDTYMDRFREETQRFTGVFGFRPTSFTVHGMGKYRQEQRMAFVGEMSRKMESMGYRFYDGLPKYLRYAYVIQDCHGGPRYEQRFILEDFLTIPVFFVPGKSYLVLTHPGYWK